MNYELIFALIFVFILSIFVYRNKDRVELQKILFPFLYFILYRTSWGIRWMDHVSEKHPRLIKWFAISGIYVGFLGMVFIAGYMIYMFVNNILAEQIQPTAALVLPSLGLESESKGIFLIPTFYWIISLTIIAIVHEFAHGVVARYYKMEVKSTGFAFFGILAPIIPAAFVEPDEKEVAKKPLKQQLAMFAAGPYSNIILGSLIWGLILLTAPMYQDAAYIENGTQVMAVFNDSAAMQAGISPGEIILSLNDQETNNLEQFIAELEGKQSKELITVTTNTSTYQFALGENPKDASKGYLGVSVQSHVTNNEVFDTKYGAYTRPTIDWFIGLGFFLIILNYGIGLFNLLPAGPLDGGRMLHAILLTYLPKEKALSIFSKVSIALGLLILASIILSFAA